MKNIDQEPKENVDNAPLSIGENDIWTQPFPKRFNKTIPINKEGPFGFATGYIPAIKVKKKKK